MTVCAYVRGCAVFAVPEMQHGWVPRGDLSVPAVERDVKAALEQATAYFTRLL